MAISAEDLAAGRAEAALTLPDRAQVLRPGAQQADAGGGMNEAAEVEVYAARPCRLEQFTGTLRPTGSEGPFAGRVVEQDQALVKFAAGSDVSEPYDLIINGSRWHVEEAAEGAWSVYRLALVRRVR